MIEKSKCRRDNIIEPLAQRRLEMLAELLEILQDANFLEC
jgi:hypothetical protein